jgi:cyclopropane-fatty-acyl-phospholipid synthase
VKTNSIELAPKHRVDALSRNQTLAKTIILKLLSKLEVGCLRIHDQGEKYSFGQPEATTTLIADITVHDPQAYADVVFGGSVGSGEAYMSGYWSSPHLIQVTRIFVANLSALDKMDEKQSLIGEWMLKFFHLFNRNTKEGARRNISAHYDLGNPFFSLFLDETMMYSSAIYPKPESTLGEAAVYKLKKVCEKLRLNAEDHLIEIGTGWGGMAIHAAKNYGCRVTTTTISKEQHDYAVKRVAEEGLSDRITVLFDDYRDLQGQFSKLVSIEMIEAVGHDHYDTYFSTCSRLLAPNGLMLLQAITIADQRYERARKAVDFIQRYIFPGGCLPSVAVISDWIKRKTDMNIIHMEDIGQHYAKTLKDWRETFLQKLDAVRLQGYDDRFIRMWEFYLAYCEAGFTERTIGTNQILIAKPEYRFGFFSS